MAPASTCACAAEPPHERWTAREPLCIRRVNQSDNNTGTLPDLADLLRPSLSLSFSRSPAPSPLAWSPCSWPPVRTHVRLREKNNPRSRHQQVPFTCVANYAPLWDSRTVGNVPVQLPVCRVCFPCAGSRSTVTASSISSRYPLLACDGSPSPRQLCSQIHGPESDSSRTLTVLSAVGCSRTE